MDPEKIFLVIAGPDDGELANLQTLTRKLQLTDQVRFVGPLYERDKLAALVDADVLVSPAIHEIFGLVPFEALLCGTPVIVADDSGLGQLIREAGAGCLVPYGNAEALANAIRSVFTNPEKARLTVEAGQQFIHTHLDWKNIAKELEDLYQDCIMHNGAGE